ncbi:MFS transporter [Natrialba asiatica]|uniref:Major facilitator superfamily (MFS) profile domain-containing protein n=1 Tax=Natrialba asiatica (strain ATCC 700177 / DSM 12278 / JCM 9576 / FERM P-10747 / NBRC 102637 / 172P1) TaxID=29540 RepID=M0B3X5_NATA1|nr:MFS transporter [Natrialba asiatica]ELZ04943.1 hypothetical protein C481_03282 [Natrialba asiatica DSM 12278]
MRELLRNGSFMRLFCGRLVTNAGDSLYYIAAMWLVYQLTGSAAFTGVAGFLTTAPSAIQFLFGPLVDRTPLRRVLVGTQLAQGILVLVIPIAAALDALSVWVVLTVMPLLSLLNQPVYPAESAALPRIVEREELVEGNSLFALAYQGADAAFNAVGGLLVAALGAVTLFLVNSLTFGIATLLFATLSIPAAGTDNDETKQTATASETAADGGRPTAANDSPASYLADLQEGIEFLRGTIVAKLLVGAAVVNFSIGGVMAVLPAYADVLGGASAYGLLTAAIGTGMLIGALVGSAVRRFPFGRVVALGMAGSAMLWVGAVAVNWLPASALLFALALVPAGVTNVLVISLVQALVPDGLLGRVTAVLGSASAAMTPVGALVGGAVAGATSATLVLWAAGASFALLALYVFAVPSLRRLPEISEVSTLTAK